MPKPLQLLKWIFIGILLVLPLANAALPPIQESLIAGPVYFELKGAPLDIAISMSPEDRLRFHYRRISQEQARLIHDHKNLWVHIVNPCKQLSTYSDDGSCSPQMLHYTEYLRQK